MMHDLWIEVFLYFGFFLSGALIFGSLFYQLGRRDEVLRSQRQARKLYLALENNPFYREMTKITRSRKEIERNANLN